MILFHQIVKVLHLSQFTAFGNDSYRFEFLEGFGRGRVFVDIDHAWLARMRGSEGFQQEALGGFSISGWTQPKVKCLSLRINRPLQVHPHFFDLDVRLVHAPGVIADFQMRSAACVQFRRIALHPAKDRRVIYPKPSLLHHFL